MRSKKAFEEERYFGLQKFNKPEEAFKVMEGIWGEINGDRDSNNLHILTDETFEKAIISQALEIYLNYKEGKKTQKEFETAFGMNDDITSELFDFDFFLYSQKTNCYFTCRMTMKDDGVDIWNERQWGYFEELWELYSLKSVILKAVNLAEDAIKRIGEYDRGGIFDIVCNEQGLFY